MFELFNYEVNTYDDILDGFDFQAIYENIANGTFVIINVNYVVGDLLFSQFTNEINDNVAEELAKESAKLFSHSMRSVLSVEEKNLKTSERSTFVFWGISSDITMEYIELLRLEKFPSALNNIRGRTTIYIGDKYRNGKSVDQTLEDDLETSPDSYTRQVIRITYYNNQGKQVLEYAGTPRQIIHWLIGGTDFAKDVLSVGAYDEQTIEDEKTEYSDGRLKPGDYFNSLWTSNFPNVIQLAECEQSFINSRNAPIFAILKTICATIDTISTKIFRVFDKFIIKKTDFKDIQYWNNVFDTTIYNYQYLSNKQQAITAIDTDIFGKIKSITVESAFQWPPFGLFWINDELLQYRQREGNTLYDIDRWIDGVKNSTISVSDVVRLIGSVKLTEKEPAHKDRLRGLAGNKDTVERLQLTADSISKNSESCNITVFDMNIKDYSTTYEYRKWAYPRYDYGWFAGSYGNVVIKNATFDYVASTKTLTYYVNDVDEEKLQTGNSIRIKYGGDDEIAEGVIFSGDIWTDTIVLVEKLKDSDGNDISDFTGKTGTVYALGSDSRSIRSSDLTDKLKTDAKTLLGRDRETSGYFQDTKQIESIYYETSVNASATTLSGLIAANDTSVYTPATYPFDFGSGTMSRAGTNAAFDYTGNVKSYDFQSFTTQKLEGKFPIIVTTDNWKFNNSVISDTIKQTKTVGTTVNLVVNKQFDLFRAITATEAAPVLDFVSVYRNTD